MTKPNDLCTCGHKREAHIYWDGACRPGFVCADHCTEFRAAIKYELLVKVERDEVIARAFHETYELLAPSFNYQTRSESAVPWDEVPQANRRLMRATVMTLLHDGTIR